MAILLSAILTITFLPIVAFAAGDETLTVGDGGYTTIQEAINAISGTGTKTILIKAGTYNETVRILQKAGINIVLQGENGTVFSGQIIIDGDARSTGTDTVTIRNIKFFGGSNPYYIDLKKFGTKTYGYAHNVTIENCTFEGNGNNFGIQAGSSSGNTAYNTVIRNCTFTNMYGVLQARCQGLTLENVVATDVLCGMNLYNSKNITLKNVKIHANYYVIRLGENSGSADNGSLNIENCDIVTNTHYSNSGAIVIRASSSVNINITSSDITGYVYNGSTRSVSLTANDVYWGDPYGIQGFNASQLNINNNALRPHNNPTYGNSVVLASADVAYTVIIPASVDFGVLRRDMGTQSRPFDVTVMNALIEDGATITIQNITTDMNMYDKEGTGNQKLGFALQQPDGKFVFTQQDLAEGEASISSEVTCEPSELKAAGSYEGFMNFEITYRS